MTTVVVHVPGQSVAPSCRRELAIWLVAILKMTLQRPPPAGSISEQGWARAAVITERCSRTPRLVHAATLAACHARRAPNSIPGRQLGHCYTGAVCTTEAAHDHPAACHPRPT